jgi:bifunctional non-homologous end joining protein LigD
MGDLRDAMPYAFDLLELNGEDLRSLPIGNRKVELAWLLRRAPAGTVYNERTDEDGAVTFRHACKLGFEGIISKRLGAPCRSGPSRGGSKSRTRTAWRW